MANNENSESNLENSEKQKSFFQRITDFSDWDAKTFMYVAIFAAILVITVWLLYRSFTDETFLFGIILKFFITPVSDLGKAGWFVFVIFMGVQGIFAPIPSELVLLSAGMIWGPVGGFVLGMLGSMLAGWICYFISKKGGRPIVEKAIGMETIETLDFYIQKYGVPVIFIARAFPFMSFDPISYVSGLIKMDFKKYMIATGIGSITRCIFYAWLGTSLLGNRQISDLTETEVELLVQEHSGTFNLYFMIILVVLAVAFLAYQYILMPYLIKKSKVERDSLRTQTTVENESETSAPKNLEIERRENT